jgi:ABC-type nitrate/sulfonate/bicarbonate transport system permease component
VALPDAFDTHRLGIVLVLMVASELILSTNGLGWFIVYTRRSLYPSLM